MTFKRIFAVIAAICLSFTVSGLFPLVAPATDGAETESVSATGSADSGSTDVDVIYDASDAYKSGKYYGNLINLTKSGDQAVDTVAIALSQALEPRIPFLKLSDREGIIKGPRFTEGVFFFFFL